MIQDRSAFARGNRTLGRIALLLVLVLLPVGAPSAAQHAKDEGAAPSAVPTSPGDDVVLISSDEHGVLFSFTPSAYTLEQATVDDGSPCQYLAVQGYGETTTPGAPNLPVRSALFAVPVGARVSVHVEKLESYEPDGIHNVCPVGTHTVELALDGTVSERRTTFKRDAAHYASAALWPEAVAELGDHGYLRDQHVIQVVLHPVQYNPVSGRLRVITHMILRLAFAGRDDSMSAGTPEAVRTTAADPFQPLYREAIVNYGTATSYPVTAASESGPELSAALLDVSGPRVRLLVRETAMYRVTGADLAELGVDIAGISPSTLSAWHKDQPVAIRVLDGGDSVLDPSDSILFYGEAIDSTDTRENAYWLMWGGDPGLRMETTDATPDGTAPVVAHHTAGERVEENLEWRSAYPSGPENDRWYWNYISAYGAPATRSYHFGLANLSTEPGITTVAALLRGYSATSGQHSCELRLNDVLLTSANWAAGSAHLIQLDVAQGALQEGLNELEVTCGVGLASGQSDIVFINRFDLTYPASFLAIGDRTDFRLTESGAQEVQVTGFTSPLIDLYDVTVPLLPVHLDKSVSAGDDTYTLGMQTTIAGTPEDFYALEAFAYAGVHEMELITPRDLRSAENGADYLIISHGDFVEAVQPLVALRESQGLRVILVDVREIYDVFGHGIVSVQAIHDFVAYAYAHWAPPAPAYLLLVGDANYDPKGYLDRGEPSYVLSYLADVDPYLGETAADNRYAAVHGTDIFPDLFLGRLPVKTVADAQAVVAKILAYEAAPEGDWQAALSFVADDPDSAGNFRALSDAIIAGYVPQPGSPYSVERIYYGIDPHETVANTRTAILNAFASGRLVINYAGHGSTMAWGGEGFFKTSQVPGLSNGILPFMVPMTCQDGYYILLRAASGTDLSCVSETLLRAPGKGAIASFAPTGEGTTFGHRYLQEGLYAALFQDGITELGAATTAAKLRLWSSTVGNRDLIDTYLLMGDPALRLKVLKADVWIDKTASPEDSLLPGETITYTLAYGNSGAATAHNVVISDPLHQALTNPVITSSGASATPRSGSSFIWDVENLAPGQGGSVTIVATVSEAYSGVIENVATISTTGTESDLTNNSDATASLIVESADLALRKSVSPTGPLAPGDAITYTLTYTNTMTDTAKDVVITDTLPAALVDPVVVSSGASITARSGTSFVWDVADLPQYTGGTITITATIDPTFTGMLENTATIETSTYDSDATNNVSSVSSLVGIPPEMYFLFLPLVVR